MAKLSTRQKNNIIAKWNTGEYTKTQLAKTYKVGEKTIRDTVGKEPPTNAEIVEAGVILEKVKKYEKSTSEVQAINQAIKYRLDSEEYKQKNIENIHNITNNILEGISNLLLKGKAQKVVTEGEGMGCSTATTVDYDLQAEHYEKAMNTVDKASITLNVNQRHSTAANVAIQNNTTTDKKQPTTINYIRDDGH